MRTRVAILRIGFPGLALLAGLGALGFYVTRSMVSDGLTSFAGDPERFAVAQNAYIAVWAVHDDPISRLFLPAARVMSVEKKIGHCRIGPEATDGSQGQMTGNPALSASSKELLSQEAESIDYLAIVQLYALFGVPVGELRLGCGGDRWMQEPTR